MSTPYSIQISMPQATVAALGQGGYQLYAFKGVQTTVGGGSPVVWFSTNVFSLNTTIDWAEQYQAYTSLSQIVPNGQIVASAAYDASLGQTLDVTGSTGIGQMVNGGTSTAISINNQTSTQMACGISEVVDGTSSPLCVFPLYGNNMDVMAPIEKVLLMFSTLPVNTGTVVFQAYSQGVLIDLTGQNSRQVNYDINKGWSWGGGAWGTIVPAQAELVPLLITSSAALEDAVLTSVTRRRGAQDRCVA